MRDNEEREYGYEPELQIVPATTEYGESEAEREQKRWEELFGHMTSEQYEERIHELEEEWKRNPNNWN